MIYEVKLNKTLFLSNSWLQYTQKSKSVPLLPEVSCFDWEFYGGAFDDQCAAIFGDLKDFCSRNHLSLHMTGVTRTLLGYSKSSEYPTATFGSLYKVKFSLSPQKKRT